MKEISVINAKIDICHARESVKHAAIVAPKAPKLRQMAAKPTVIISTNTKNRAIDTQICHISIVEFLSLNFMVCFLSRYVCYNFFCLL